MPTHSLMTSSDFANTGPETDDCELVRGQLVKMPLAKGPHGAACARVAFVLSAYAKGCGRGTVMSNGTGLLTQVNPDTVRSVDVMVYLNPSWAGKDFPEEYNSEPPDLAVEVRSPDQSWKQLLEKVAEYLSLGVRLVWLVDPNTERVHVFQPDMEPQVFAAGNELEGGQVLLGFGCKVEAIFEV